MAGLPFDKHKHHFVGIGISVATGEGCVFFLIDHDIMGNENPIFPGNRSLDLNDVRLRPTIDSVTDHPDNHASLTAVTR